MIITTLLVVAIFSLLVFVHELGHFLVARRNGVEVDEFGFGFPPRVVGKKVGKTLYSINAIPLGGFVRLRGEDMRDTSPGSFGSASMWVKTKIMLAGVVMNTLLAYLLLLVLCLTGLPSAFTAGFKLPAPITSTAKQVMVLNVSEDTPAGKAGLSKGDIIVAVNGKSLSSESDLTSFTKAHAGETVKFSLEQDGKSRVIDIKLNDKEVGKKAGYLGVLPLQVHNQRYGLNSIWVAASLTVQMLGLTALGVLQMFANLPGLMAGVFQAGVPQAAETVAGPIGIFTALQNIKLLGFNYLVFFITTISIALAVFNVLPIPVLDGGKLALIWLQRLLKRTFSPETEGKIYAISFALLGVLVLVVSVFDIRRL